MLIFHNLPPMHWALAGASIGLITLLLLWIANRRLGISTTFEQLCGIVSNHPHFRRPELQGRHRWRLPFAVGLLLGGVISAATSGGWAPTWELGMFDAAIGWGRAGKLAWMFAGGVLVGFGTRLADGCTSGHGVFGMANLEKASFISVACFMITGFLTTNLIYRVIF